ncbi:hypothetical protein HanPSC8_Chr11g0484261 [Helianthus annuus]|nr:hypothetical protein HanPSC8_Chr11g0484261 [Helianthus annuus]
MCVRFLLDARSSSGTLDIHISSQPSDPFQHLAFITDILWRRNYPNYYSLL